MLTNKEPEPIDQPKNPTAPPRVGEELRLKQQVSDALESIPGGDMLDKYFGITTGSPEQSVDEARNSESLIQDLRDTSLGETSLSDLFGKISEHNTASGVDPEALRALMRGSTKKNEE